MPRRVDFQLQGKRALISGSTAGIGFAIARALAAEGASVIVKGRTEQRTAAAASAIRDSGLPDADVRGVAADLGSAEGCARMLQQLPEVDILVNNLGIFEAKPFGEI